MERFFKYGLTILISTVAAMEFYQVVMRYILELPVMGLEELLVYPTLWLYFLGSVNASREDTQIKANVLDVFLKTDRARLKVRVVPSLLFGWWGHEYVHVRRCHHEGDNGLGIYPTCQPGAPLHTALCLRRHHHE